MTDIVRGVMAEEGLFTDCVPNMYRIQDVFGTSRCFCARCSRVWTSHMTWVKFDLRSQRILKNWKQLCVVCSCTVNPYINGDELERMAKLAVERCVSLTNGTFVLRTSARRNPPHNTMACEKCRDGGRPCWIIKQKTDSESSTASSPCPSVSGATSSSSDSDLDAISDDLAKLVVVPSADSSVVSSRAESPSTASQGFVPPPCVPAVAQQQQQQLQQQQQQQQQLQQQQQQLQQQYARNPYAQIATAGAGYGYPPSHYASQVYYQPQVFQTQPSWYHQTPVYTAVPPHQWY